MGGGDGEDVEDAAAAAELAGGLDDTDRLIADLLPAGQALLQVERLADAQNARAGDEAPLGQRLLQEGAGRGDDERRHVGRGHERVLPGDEVGQRRQPPGAGAVAPRAAIIGQRRRLRQAVEAATGRQPRFQGLMPQRGRVHSPGQQQDGRARRDGQPPVKLSDNRGARAARQVERQQRAAFVAAQRGRQLPEGGNLVEQVEQSGDVHPFLSGNRLETEFLLRNSVSKPWPSLPPAR